MDRQRNQAEASPCPTTNEQRTALREFSLGVAHEIRNPLAIIQSLVERLAQKTADAEQKALAKAIVAEVGRLNRFLSEFLQFSRMPALQLEKVQVKTLIEGALTFAISPEQQGINLKTNIPEELPPVHLDPSAFRQVLMNVITNAIHAMKGIGDLEIQAEVVNRHFTVKIKDTGIGISEENQAKIFLPFFSTKGAGTGLGLAISQQIIEDHGGKICFKNNEGKGVTLFIDVPQPPDETG